MKAINPITWFSDRELRYNPGHFILVRIPIDNDRMEWILDNLSGRFCLVDTPGLSSGTGYSHNVQDWGYYPAFEDPAEAIHYQLIWG